MSRDPTLSGDSLEVRPVTADRWQELADLFGPSGAFTGTLSMFTRAGFYEVDRPRGVQLVVRRTL